MVHLGFALDVSPIGVEWRYRLSRIESIDLFVKAHMSINRLRQILQSNLLVRLDSSTRTLQKVQKRIAKRVQEFAQKGEVPEIKTPSVVGALQQTANFNLRPVDLLRKIGQLTTPSSLNMAQFSASWATRRYFWAIQPGAGDFRLSQDARQLDFHQKTLLSDEFGIGMAGVVMERYFSTDGFSDVSAALADPTFGLQHQGDPEPDYIMWNTAAGQYYVVECKGCQTNRSTALDQIRRAMEQLPTVSFRNTNRTMVSLVIATLLDKTSTTVIVLDPSDDEREFRDKDVSQRISQRRWRVENEEKFTVRAEELQRSHLLKWSGQSQAAAMIDEHIEVQRVRAQDLTNAPLETREIAGEIFDGFDSSLFPELGNSALRVFSGVQRDLLEAARSSGRALEEAKRPIQERLTVADRWTADPYTSVGVDGTCLRVEGI